MTVRGQRDERARRVVLVALQEGLSVSAAAREAGIARSTIYKWVERGDQTMKEALNAARRSVGGLPHGPPPPQNDPPQGPEQAQKAPAGAPPPEPVEARLRRLGLGVLAKLAQGQGNHDGEVIMPAVRMQAAGKLALLCGSTRHSVPLAQSDPEPPKAEPVPELSEQDATKRFRVVS